MPPRAKKPSRVKPSTAKNVAPLKGGPSATVETFYRAVKRVPKGRVSTYGAIAVVAKKPLAARQVGFALGALRDPNTDVPWHRILASRSPRHGAITPRGGGFATRQRRLLEAEGVRFDALGRVDLREFGWPESTVPKSAAPPRKPSKASPGRAGRRGAAQRKS